MVTAVNVTAQLHLRHVRQRSQIVQSQDIPPNCEVGSKVKQIALILQAVKS